MDTSVNDTNGNDLLLPIGTAVSAKFRGAFCEARISDCIPNVKYKILVTKSNETVSLEASEIDLISPPRGHDRCKTDEVYPAESVVKILKTNQVGLVKKTIDASSYTIIFDDNDMSTVLRHELKLKGQKHYKDFETLDAKTFGIEDGFSQTSCSNQGLESLRSRSKRQSRNSLNCEVPDAKINFSTSESESNTVEDYYSSATEDEEANSPANVNNWILTHLDQVIWAEKSRGSSFPGLVIDPWETDKKRDAGNHCIIRSFRDNRFYSIPFKYIKPFDRSLRSDKPQLQSAIDVASAYITDNVLPKTWVITYRQIFADIVEFLQDDSVPEYVTSGAFSIELGRLFFCVWTLGGFEIVCQMKLWPTVVRGISKANLNWGSTPSPGFIAKMKSDYKKYLSTYQEVFDDRLGANEDNPLPSMEFNPTKTDVSFKNEVIRPSSAPSQIPARRIRCVDDQVDVSYRDGKRYPAKILKIDTSRPSELGIYFVHYKNWNSRHDEWISENVISASDVASFSSTTPVPFGATDKSIHGKKEPTETTMTQESPLEHKVSAKRGAPPSSNVSSVYADALVENSTRSAPSGEKEFECQKESTTLEVKAQQSSLSQKIAEKRYKMMQSSASENSEASCNIFKSKVRFGQRLSPAAKKEELEQTRNVSISSSDEDSPEKFPVRSPRKLPARRRTPKKSENVGSSIEVEESFPDAEKSCMNVRRKLSEVSEKGFEATEVSAAMHEQPQGHPEQNVGSPSRKRSATGCIKETQEEMEKFAEASNPNHYRSPPKRRRVVKRVSETDRSSQRATTNSPVKEENTSLEHLKVEKEDEQLYDEGIGDTNDEGFSADEECESDDTIDMNKPMTLTPPAYKDLPSTVHVGNSENDGEIDCNQPNDLDEKYVAKEEYLGELSVSTKITHSFLSRLDMPCGSQKTDTPMFQLPLDEKLKSGFADSSCSAKSGKGENVCIVESPTGSRTLSKKNKRGVSSDAGTPLGPKIEPCGTPGGSLKRAAKRNGKNGQYKHGFFISDPEDSEVDELGSSGMGDYLEFSRQNSANHNDANRCNLNFYSFQNSEDDCEKILDVSVLDEIDDVDERIRIAEEQMNLIRKRYNLIYKEMEKLDNLKRRIRKRNKLKQNNADEPSPRIAFQEDSNESPGKNGGEISQDQLSDSVAITSAVNSNCEISPTSGLDTLSTVSSKLCWVATESLCSSEITQQNETSFPNMERKASPPRRDDEETSLAEESNTAPITSTASGINITEDQLNAVESLMSLRSQLS